MANVTFRVFSEQLGNRSAEELVAKEGDLFYNPESPILRVGDGETPGGVIMTPTIVTFTDETEFENYTPAANELVVLINE